MTGGPLATRRTLTLAPDASRVIARLFVPGHTVGGGSEGRASAVVEHILALSDDEVAEELASILRRFGHRHLDLNKTFRRHADRIRNRLGPDSKLSERRWLLLGATFTQEYAVEAAALCNPSAVAAPDQSTAPDGSLRFVMSVRQIGEGHRSSIGFRAGLVDEDGEVSIDRSSPYTTAGAVEPSVLDADVFRGAARRLHDDAEAITWVLDGLGARFTIVELDIRLNELEAQHDTRRNVSETARQLRDLAARTYTAQFLEASELAERVLHPATAAESNGIEDARFVRFVDDDDTVVYYATCTAYDGSRISQQLFATVDFLSFSSSPLFGAATDNKGMALFPRRIRGRFVALSRHNGASSAIAMSDDVRQWSTATPLECPTGVWDAVQIGNCGSPIETEEGWLVLTHGVGPMRTYSIGAWLLDLDDPTRILGRLEQPLLSPREDEQDGYVPNVVYSCGALVHGANLLIPFGVGDRRIGFATVPTRPLLAAMRRDG